MDFYNKQIKNRMDSKIVRSPF